MVEGDLEVHFERVDELLAEVSPVLEQFWAERDAANATITRVRAVHVISDMGECIDCRASWPCPTIVALDASGVTESTSDEHVDRHGRSWDRHPFAQSRAVDNVRACICGLGPDHRIHQPIPGSTEDGSDDER